MKYWKLKTHQLSPGLPVWCLPDQTRLWVSDFNCLAFQHNWHSWYTLSKLPTIPAMSDVMLAMYLQQSNEKVFVKTYTTDWLADKGNSKINIIESLLSLIFLLVRPLLWKSPQRNDVWWNREILDILPRLPSQYTLHYTICTADNSWETGGLSCFPTLSSPGSRSPISPSTCWWNVTLQMWTVDTSLTDETLAVFDLTTS